MVVAAEVSRRMGHHDDETVALHRELLTRAGAMVTIPEEVDLDEVMRRLHFDNKRGYLADSAESSAMILLGGLDEPLSHDDRPLVSVPMVLVRSGNGFGTNSPSRTSGCTGWRIW